jgi:hypothetical protein
VSCTMLAVPATRPVQESKHEMRPLYLDNAATTPIVRVGGTIVASCSWCVCVPAAHRTHEYWMLCYHICQLTMATLTLGHMRMVGRVRRQWRWPER